MRLRDPVCGMEIGREEAVRHACDGEPREEVGPPERARRSISRAAIARIGRHTALWPT